MNLVNIGLILDTSDTVLVVEQVCFRDDLKGYEFAKFVIIITDYDVI